MTGAAGFPAPIAAALQAYEAETDLFRRQARLIAVFEALIQYSAILAVSEFYHAGLEREFPDVDDLIREQIHRPSTGTWQRLFREALGAFRARPEALASAAFYSFGFDSAGRQQPWMRAADLITHLRNEQKGHGHVLADEDEYRAILLRHDALLRQLLDAATFAAELPLYVVLERSERGITAARLMGPVEVAGPIDQLPADPGAPDKGNVGVRNPGSGQWRDLSPLLQYLECERDVERVDGQGNVTRTRCGRPGIFFHHELVPPTRLRGFEFRLAHHSAWRFPEFAFVGRYLERYGRRPAGGRPQAEWYDARLVEAQRLFVGREDALARLTASALEHKGRPMVVVAPPGYGKSTLLARWTARMEGETPPEGRVHVFRHFIQEQYPESGRASQVFDILRLQVCTRFDLDPTPPHPDDRSRAERYRAALLASLRLAAERPERPTIVVVIDGLDEALKATAPGEQEALLDMLPARDLLPPGTGLVLSGRPIVETLPAFRARFGRDRADYLELARLTDVEVREWFELAFGAVYALEHSAFLDRVAAAARGHPQYLHFAERALMDGSLQPDRAETLPAGLEDFYARVMEDASGEQPLALRIIALLAAAAAPLDLAVLSAVLGESPEGATNGCDAARNVLEWDAAGRVLLFDAEFAEWVRAGDVRTPRDMLRRETFAAMLARLLAWCHEWPVHRHPYAAANLVTHLVSLERHDEVAALARNAAFLQFQATARPDAPDLPLATLRAAFHHAQLSGTRPAAVEFALRRIAWTTRALSESPMDAYQAGSLTRALRLADLKDPAARLAWYCMLAAEVARRDGASAAERLLGLPGRLAWWIPDDSSADLGGVADAMLLLRELPFFPALWRLYLDRKARARLAAHLVGVGSPEQAEALLLETPASPERDQALIRLAGNAAAAGDFERAYRFTNDMWLSESRWTARAHIAATAASTRGLEVVAEARREAARDPRASDILTRQIAVTFGVRGRFEDAIAAADQVARPEERDLTFGTLARDALSQGQPETAAELIARIRPVGTLRRALLDRATLAALWPPRPRALARIVAADPIASRLALLLAGLTVVVGVAMAVAVASGRWEYLTPWGAVLWVAGALAITIGLRNRSWRAALSGAAWALLTGLSLGALSDGSALALFAAALGGGAALLLSLAALGLDRIRESLVRRMAGVTITALAVTLILALLPGPALVRWTFGSLPIAMALILPGGAAIGAAAFAASAPVEERLTYHAAAAVPALVLTLLHVEGARGIPYNLLLGWMFAGMLCVLRPLLVWAGIPGRRVLFLAMAEFIRAALSGPAYRKSADANSPLAMLIVLAVIIAIVAVQRRQATPAPTTAEAPTGVSTSRPRTLGELLDNPARHIARLQAELFLRLARLFPSRKHAVARAALRQAADLASMVPPPDPDASATGPERRDLLWQVAREAWRRRAPGPAWFAAWRVEWRWWSGMVAASGALVVGAALGLLARSFVPRFAPGAPPVSLAALAIVGGVAAALVALPFLRSAREVTLAIPFTAAAAIWVTRPLTPLTLAVFPGLALVLVFVAGGAGVPGRRLAWFAALLTVWRRQLVFAIPLGFLACGVAVWVSRTPDAKVIDLMWRPTLLTWLFVFLSWAPLDPLTRPARTLVPRRASDLAPLTEPPQEPMRVLERAASAGQVHGAVVRMAETDPAILADVTRAALLAR